MIKNSWVVPFEAGHAGMKQLLGGKGANLAEMTKAGLPVPPGFTVTTDACRAFYENGSQLPGGLFEEILDQLTALEQAKRQTFGGRDNPLLVSVRSGSVTSMPGMMDTILNLGLNDETVQGLAEQTGNPRFAYDCYRRLIQMFGTVVYQMESISFEHLLADLKKREQVSEDHKLQASALLELIEQFKALIVRKTGKSFPQSVQKQLYLSVEAVFRSWNNQRAQVYRKLYSIPDEQGTAVNIQSMVFGNMGMNSATGVLFTRNSSTGAKELYGEFLMNAQGEDVVAGTRTPAPISELETLQPDLYQRLMETARQLESHYRDMQDIEFTIEEGRLFVLQTRNGKRTAQAAVKLAVDLAGEGVINKEEAVCRIEMEHLDQLLHRVIDPEAEVDVLARGLPASPGAGSGQVVFDADTADAWAKEGRQVILASTETTPEDIHGVIAAEGVLTTRGGMTSHAAVVARGMGKPCVCGCEAAVVDASKRELRTGGRTVCEGEWITLDGSSGRVILGTLPLIEPEMSEELRDLLLWADEIRQLQVLANADTPEDAAKAREFGAQGVGLCRTEHMFMSAERLPVVQEMILADSTEARRAALDKLLPMQRDDFTGIFTAMNGLPVTIRLLDPPLHEFLPDLEELQEELRELSSNGDEAGVRGRITSTIQKVKSLHEMNPMLGQRGCRLGILFPEIYSMQAIAIFQAALLCKERGVDVHPEIMIPFVGHMNELKRLRMLIDRAAEQTFASSTAEAVTYKVGTMIEVPRAAITAGQIARYADFFSFGTNDLTQMTFGCSRDDAEGKFLSHYVDHDLLEHNPFQVLDQEGVGKLIEWAVREGRAQHPKLKTGICGEHGGDKSSIYFCQQIGLNYVSCSPYRVPLARIAAAQAVVIQPKEENSQPLLEKSMGSL